MSGWSELKGKVDRIGYSQIGLVNNGKQHWFLSHRIVAAAFLNDLHREQGEFLTVNHKNRIKTDNRLCNLELVTVAQNHQHWRKLSLEQMKSS